MINSNADTMTEKSSTLRHSGLDPESTITNKPLQIDSGSGAAMTKPQLI